MRRVAAAPARRRVARRVGLGHDGDAAQAAVLDEARHVVDGVGLAPTPRLQRREAREAQREGLVVAQVEVEHVQLRVAHGVDGPLQQARRQEVARRVHEETPVREARRVSHLERRRQEVAVAAEGAEDHGLAQRLERPQRAVDRAAPRAHRGAGLRVRELVALVDGRPVRRVGLGRVGHMNLDAQHAPRDGPRAAREDERAVALHGGAERRAVRVRQAPLGVAADGHDAVARVHVGRRRPDRRGARVEQQQPPCCYAHHEMGSLSIARL